MPKIEWTEDAIEDLQRLDKPITRRVLSKISWLSNHFSNITPESLSADMSGMFKIRVGDWRVVYTVEDNIIVIQAIGHRKEVYR